VVSAPHALGRPDMLLLLAQRARLRASRPPAPPPPQLPGLAPLAAPAPRLRARCSPPHHELRHDCSVVRVERMLWVHVLGQTLVQGVGVPHLDLLALNPDVVDAAGSLPIPVVRA